MNPLVRGQPLKSRMARALSLGGSKIKVDRPEKQIRTGDSDKSSRIYAGVTSIFIYCCKVQ